MTLSFSISVEVGGQRINVGPHGVQGNAKGVHVQTGHGRTSIQINPSSSRQGHSRSSSFTYTTPNAPTSAHQRQPHAHQHAHSHAFMPYGHQSQPAPHVYPLNHTPGQWPPFTHRPDSYEYDREVRRRAAEERLHAASQRSRTHNEQHAREREAKRQAAEARLREAEERARLKAEEQARAARRAQRERQKAMDHAARVEQERRERQRAIKDTWTAYDAQGSSPPPRLKFRTLLWPVLSPPSRAPPQAPGAPPVVTGLTREALREFLLSPMHSAGVSERARVHAALRRWHPDKMGRILERVVERDRAAVEEGVRIVAGELAALLKEVSEARRA